MPFSWNTQYVPLDARIVLAKIDPDLHFVSHVLIDVFQVDLDSNEDGSEIRRRIVSSNNFFYLNTVVRPGTELHEASLLIEGKISNVYLARGFEDSRRRPQYLARVMQDGFGHRGNSVLPVRAEISPMVIPK